MKNLYTIIMVAAGLLMLVSCMKETVEPEQRISGEFVPSPDNPLDGCSSYVVFQKGYYAVKRSNNFYYFAENKLWNCNERNFSSLAKIPYYISGGELFLEGKSQGAISLKGDILTINGRKYEKLIGFSEKHFFKIVPASTTVTSDYTTHSISVPYTITSEYPATHAELTVSCKESWVENISVSADKITFNVQENNSRTQRNANLDLILPYAETVRVNLTQSYASSSLSFTPSSQSAPYTSGSYSFICAVTNPRVGVNITAVSQNDWITDVVVSGNTVSYKVAENNSGTSRTGRISLAYGDYASRIFYVEQSWSSSSITLTPSSQNTDYTGGTYSFQYAVTNPREGVAVTAVSLSEWVTDVVVSGSIISYKVSENISGIGRVGKVRLSYASYASKDFIINQSGKPVQTLSLNKSNLAMFTGNSETLVATVEPTDAPLQWSSENTSVATVNQSGLVSAIGNGMVAITVRAENGKSASCTVTVTTLVTGITLNKTSLTLSEGVQEQLEATISPSDASDKSVTWSSDDTSVATVDQSGKVTAVSKGMAIIKAMANDGSGKSAFCTVNVNRLVSSIDFDKTSIVLYNGETATITATVLLETASNRQLTWTSSDASVATVSSMGVVTGVARGSATITATAKDGSGISQTCEVEVKQYVTEITLDKTSAALLEGQVEKLSPTVSPSTANDQSVTWSSSNTDVAAVDQNGNVTAVSKGSATIKVTAKDGSGISASCSVSVIQASGVVDLGLSVKWAACNISESGFVSSPEQYGDYYAWGETEPYYAEGHSQDKPCSSWRSRTNPAISGYNWSSYKWCNGSYRLTKYNTKSDYGETVDNKTVLEADDDVAHVKLGGSWRMPTDAEWTELRNNCTWTWTILNGINGLLVTSKKNGASIFLPAAGDRVNTTLRNVGSYGNYWSSSLYKAPSIYTGYPYDPHYAYSVCFHSRGVYRDNDDRCDGFSVRPVSD